ncbi:hypothetical protein [Streptomyces sp. bgisy022]|uniref:SCO2584 family spore wall biosynthesis protein n=1 Tax=Streptomyces sp. bgisy022 TaxID=3413769 RepID=UPI003D71ADEB
MTPQVYSGSVPEDVGGTPFPDGWEPDDDHDRGVTDEEFASVVFDEDFVRAARVHEPSAVERLLAAARARAEAAEAEAARGERYPDRYGHRGARGPDGPDDDPDVLEDPYGSRPYGGQARWHRSVAWILALVMGIGMVALAFSAVYRGGSAHRQDPVPSPTSTVPERDGAAAPSASADYSRPTVPVIPQGP